MCGFVKSLWTCYYDFPKNQKYFLIFFFVSFRFWQYVACSACSTHVYAACDTCSKYFLIEGNQIENRKTSWKYFFHLCVRRCFVAKTTLSTPPKSCVPHPFFFLFCFFFIIRNRITFILPTHCCFGETTISFCHDNFICANTLNNSLRFDFYWSCQNKRKFSDRYLYVPPIRFSPQILANYIENNVRSLARWINITFYGHFYISSTSWTCSMHFVRYVR